MAGNWTIVSALFGYLDGILNVYSENTTTQEYTVLVQSISQLGFAVSLAADLAGDQVYVVSQAGENLPATLSTFARNTTTGSSNGSLTLEASTTITTPTQPSKVSVSEQDGSILIVGASNLAAKYTLNTSTAQLTLAQTFNLTVTNPPQGLSAMSVHSVIAVDVGQTSNYQQNVYYGTDAGLEVWRNNALLATFPLTGITDVKVDTMGQDVVAVSSTHGIYLYSVESGAWELTAINDDTTNVQQLAWSFRPVYPTYSLYGLTSSGSLVEYNVIVSGNTSQFNYVFNSSGIPVNTFAASNFAYGTPTAISMDVGDNRILALTTSNPVVYVVNLNGAVNPPTLDTVLAQQVTDSGSGNLTGQVGQSGITFGQTGVIDGAATFNGSNSAVQLGGGDYSSSSAWTAEFVLEPLSIPNDDNSSAYLLDGTTGSLARPVSHFWVGRLHEVRHEGLHV